MNRNLVIALALVAGCAGEKAPADDSFSEFAGLDEKSEKFTGKMTIVGSLDYGQTSATISHKAGTWSAFKFAGDKDDQVTVDAKSSNGDTVAWVLDNDFNILGYNDDYKTGTNSHIEVKLTANASRTHYIVVRDYYRSSMKFTASLKGVKPQPPAFDTPCSVDADCARVRPDCCQLQDWIAVRKDKVSAFRSSLSCPSNLICPAIAVRENHAVAECVANKCVAVLPKDINCGGHTVNMHMCPNDWQCEGPQLAVDGTGKCFQQCGGIRGLGCDGVDQICADNPADSCDPANGGADCMGECRESICSGQTARCQAGFHWSQWDCNCLADPRPVGSFCGGIAAGAFPCASGQTCIDNPNDSCDPNHGGADCGGICVYDDDCRVTGCNSGSSCGICWNPQKYSCVPNGALC